MKRIVLVSIATAALSIGALPTASAADMPVKAPVAVAPAFSWTGCYIGANTGGSAAETVSISVRPATISLRPARRRRQT